MKIWHENYLNIPYAQYNCAGLLKLVWLKELNINIDINCDFNPSNYDKRQDLILKQALNFKKINEPIDKCAVLMHSQCGTVGHVGVYIDFDNGYILHAHKDYNASIIEHKNDVFLKNKLYGYYWHD
jgi:hypothetical protein